jgi:nucleotide-binding universal stress UspA family protein
MTTGAHLEQSGSVSLVPQGAVVVGLDDVSTSARALDWAVDEARLQGRPLVLSHAVDPDGSRGRAWAAAAEVLAEATDHARHRAGSKVEVQSFVQHAEPDAMLVALSARASSVVLGSHGRGGIGSFLLGSVSAAVARRAECPVVVHRPHAHPGQVRRGVAVGLSATDHSHRTLDFAFATASSRGWPLTVVHVVSDAESLLMPAHLVTGPDLDLLADERLQVAEAVAGFAETYPDVHTRTLVARGGPEECLTRVADRMHLLVVGRGSEPRRLGRPTAVAVLENADCPVAVVPS